jgi:hypothetical protein
MKKYLFAMLLLPLLLTSCEEKEVDLRDSLVGAWSMEANGSVLLHYNGTVIGTIPVTDNWDVDITKSGESSIDIDGLIAKVSGNTLIFETQTQTENADGVTMQLTTKRTGTATGKLISIKEVYSGTYQGGGKSGIVSGGTSYTLTKN